MTGSAPNGDRCAKSKRVDGPWHSWAFDGDDARVFCVFCGERRDALSGVPIPGRPLAPDPAAELVEAVSEYMSAVDAEAEATSNGIRHHNRRVQAFWNLRAALAKWKGRNGE